MIDSLWKEKAEVVVTKLNSKQAVCGAKIGVNEFITILNVVFM